MNLRPSIVAEVKTRPRGRQREPYRRPCPPCSCEWCLSRRELFGAAAISDVLSSWRVAGRGTIGVTTGEAPTTEGAHAVAAESATTPATSRA